MQFMSLVFTLVWIDTFLLWGHNIIYTISIGFKVRMGSGYFSTILLLHLFLQIFFNILIWKYCHIFILPLLKPMVQFDLSTDVQ